MKRIILFLLLVLHGNILAQNGWFWQYPKPQGNTLRDIFIFDQNTAIAVGDLGTIIKTSDGGATWKTKHHIADVSQDLFDLYFLDKLRGWAVGGSSGSEKLQGVLLMTEDGGGKLESAKNRFFT